MALSMIVLVYVVARVGHDIGGDLAATALVLAFLTIEVFLFVVTRSFSGGPL